MDRDGVINERIPGAYIERIPEQFKFTNNCLEAMSMFNDIFQSNFSGDEPARNRERNNDRVTTG